MKKFYFTFGSGQEHERCFTVIEAKDSSEAREKMFEEYDNRWAFQYDEGEWINEKGLSQQEKWNLKEIK